jgi:uncharacterized tellurite resistance protein B-like protein
MLKTLKDLFDAFAPAQAHGTPADSEHLLQLAAAVLLVEVMRSDREIDAAEQEAVLAALQTRFALTRDEGERLVELAHDRSRAASDYFTFTSRINDSFDMDQKVRMIEYMWQVAYADGTLDAHENHVMRRLSDLLHVPHGAYVNAKMRAAQQAAGRRLT